MKKPVNALDHFDLLSRYLDHADDLAFDENLAFGRHGSRSCGAEHPGHRRHDHPGVKVNIVSLTKAHHGGHHTAPTRSATTATSAGTVTFTVDASGAIRRISPASALPGPTSMNRSTPRPTIVVTQSAHRTGETR